MAKSSNTGWSRSEETSEGESVSESVGGRTVTRGISTVQAGETIDFPCPETWGGEGSETHSESSVTRASHSASWSCSCSCDAYGRFLCTLRHLIEAEDDPQVRRQLNALLCSHEREENNYGNHSRTDDSILRTSSLSERATEHASQRNGNAELWTSTRALLRPILDDLARLLWQARRVLTEDDRVWVKHKIDQLFDTRLRK